MSTKQNFYDYLFGAAMDDRERLIIQHDIFKPRFDAMVVRLLDDYGLEDQIKQRKARGEKSWFLDVGCGEGLFLYDVAAVLEARGLLEAVELIGIDRDENAIHAANQLKQVSAQPYLKFYVHDITRPLEETAELEQAAKFGFDFIFAIVTMEHVANARQHLATLYQHLTPGGVMYLRDTVLGEGERGWLAPLPVMAEFFRVATGFIGAVNGGIEVASEQGKWLAEMDAEKVDIMLDIMPADDASEAGRQYLRNFVMAVRGIGPLMVKRGMLSQNEFEHKLEVIYHDLNPESKGQASCMDTLARKPR